MNLQATLLQEYRQHPSFRFEVSPLSLDESLEESFNNAYRRISRYATHLSASAFRQVSEACSQAMVAVFAQLRGQSTDVMELHFLAELEVEALRLLNDEIGFLRLAAGRCSSWLADSSAVGYADTLAREHHLFGRLDSSTLDEICAIAARPVAGLRAANEAGARTRDALSLTSGPVVRGICRLLNRYFGQQGLLDAVSAYSGCRMKVAGLALELSVPQTGWWNNRLNDIATPPRTLYAHLDESISRPKAIIYLSDVGLDQGPTCVYPQAYQSLGVTPLQELTGRVVGSVGQSRHSPLHAHYAGHYHQSSSSENFRRHYMRLPDTMRFNSHFGWDVLPGGRVEQFLVEREKQMLGPAGTFVVFDGARLLHRGGLINEGERIALQVIFSDGNLGRRIMNRLKKGSAV